MNSAPLVLAVDDMPDARNLVAEVLESAGLRVVGAEDGKSALQLAFELTPSLILLDLSLPELDGWEIAQRLTRDARTRHIPILALSAFGLAIHRDRALAAGASGFLSKPCSRSSLLGEVQRLLAESRARATGALELSAEAAR